MIKSVGRLHFHAKEFLEHTLRDFGRVCTYIFLQIVFVGRDGSMHVGYMIKFMSVHHLRLAGPEAVA
jgi:hypothetical protein